MPNFGESSFCANHFQFKGDLPSGPRDYSEPFRGLMTDQVVICDQLAELVEPVLHFWTRTWSVLCRSYVV